jgi:hypothetical protein
LLAVSRQLDAVHEFLDEIERGGCKISVGHAVMIPVKTFDR